MKKKILMLCYSDLSREPRLLRQIIALKNDFEITTVGLKRTEFNGVKHINVSFSKQKPFHWKYNVFFRKLISFYVIIFQKLKFLYPNYFYNKKYWTSDMKLIYTNLINFNYDLIIAHHWDTLPLAVKLSKKNNSKLIFNAHDYYERQFEENKSWLNTQGKFVQNIMKQYVPSFNYIFAAWTKIHDDYIKKYKVPSIIINNATEYYNLSPKYIDNGTNQIKIIHHGIANPNRKIEEMIKIIDLLDERFTIDFILVPSDYHLDYYKMLTKKITINNRLSLRSPVPTREIPNFLNDYDIGLFLLPQTGFNPTYTLPNKLYEFIQGRLASLVTPNIEMKRIVERYNIGWVSVNFYAESIANLINSINIEDLNEKKKNSHKYANILSAESNYKKIIETVNNVINKTDE